MTDFRAYIANIDATVPVIGGSRPYINFDNAASTPPLARVMQAVDNFVPWYSSVHRGSGFKSRLSTAAYEDARRTIGEFVGADPVEYTVIFGKNTTEALNKLAYRLNLRKKDIVLISHLEHHSNDLPWRQHATVKRIALKADGSIDKASYLALLNLYSRRVRLVSISGASNVTGHLPDIQWFAKKAHKYGAQIAVDCAQLAAHRPIKMGALSDPAHLDYIALSAHKMYAPFGSGALVGRRDTFIRGEPEYRGGGTISFVTSKSVDWAAPPDSDEAGSPNVVGAIAFACAAQTLQSIGLPAIAAHEAQLTRTLLAALPSIPGITLYGDTSPANAAQRSGVVPFSVAGMPAQLVAAILGYEWGIGVRSGCFCAQPFVMSLLGASKAEQHHIRYHILHRRRDRVPGLVRVSFGMYNNETEIQVLVQALRALAAGQHAPYIVDPDTGVYTPKDYQDRFTDYFSLQDQKICSTNKEERYNKHEHYGKRIWTNRTIPSSSQLPHGGSNLSPR